MAEPDEIWFVCPRCGASNPSAAEPCIHCGTAIGRFGWEVTIRPPGSPPEPTPSSPRNPYEAPRTLPEPGSSIRLSTVLLLIALIAVCLGVARMDVGVGIAFTIFLILPALSRTMIVAGKSKDRGMPLTPLQLVGSFVASVLMIVAIPASAIIAFCVTCFPIAGASNNAEVAIPAGLLAALVAMIATGYFLFVLRRRRMDRGIRYIDDKSR